MRRLAMLMTLILTSCGPAPVLRVDGAWVRLSLTPTGAAAGYFTVYGGPVADRLMDVSSPVVIRTELHESMTHSGMASMKAIEGGVNIPAKGLVEFKPGGKHAMMFNVNPGIVPPRTLPMIFVFASGERITVDAKVLRVGDE